ATGVERAHGELGARLADGLRGDDADGLAGFDELARRHRPAVAGAADAVLRVARERRSDAHPLDARGGDELRRLAVDVLAARDDALLRLRVVDVHRRDAAEQTVGERLDHADL